MIADSFGRPWRLGQADAAIGAAGVLTLDDWRGRRDAHGATLGATVIAAADELAAAADLARDKTSAMPAVHIRGAERWWTEQDGPGAAAALQRPEGDGPLPLGPAQSACLSSALEPAGSGAPSSVNSGAL